MLKTLLVITSLFLTIGVNAQQRNTGVKKTATSRTTKKATQAKTTQTKSTQVRSTPVRRAKTVTDSTKAVILGAPYHVDEFIVKFNESGTRLTLYHEKPYFGFVYDSKYKVLYFFNSKKYHKRVRKFIKMHPFAGVPGPIIIIIYLVVLFIIQQVPCFLIGLFACSSSITVILYEPAKNCQLIQGMLQ